MLFTSPVILGNLLFIIWAHIANNFCFFVYDAYHNIEQFLYVFKCKRGKIDINDQPVILAIKLDDKNKI